MNLWEFAKNQHIDYWSFNLGALVFISVALFLLMTLKFNKNDDIGRIIKISVITSLVVTLLIIYGGYSMCKNYVQKFSNPKVVSEFELDLSDLNPEKGISVGIMDFMNINYNIKIVK